MPLRPNFYLAAARPSVVGQRHNHFGGSLWVVLSPQLPPHFDGVTLIRLSRWVLKVTWATGL